MERVMLPLCFRGMQWVTGIATFSLPLFYTIRWKSLPILIPPSNGSSNLGRSSEGSCDLCCHHAAPLPSHHLCPPLGGVWAAAVGWAGAGCAWGLLSLGTPGVLPHSRFSQPISEVSGRLRGTQEMLQWDCFLHSKNCLLSAHLEPLAPARPSLLWACKAAYVWNQVKKLSFG